MIKKIKGSLFIKVFITTAILLTGVSFLVYLILAWYTPKTYSNTLNATLDEQTKIFISEISQMPMEETGGIFDNFLDYQNVDRMELFEENGNRINLPTERSADNDVVIETKAWGNEDNNAPIISNSYTVSFLGKNTNYTLVVYGAAGQVAELQRAFQKVFPLLAFIVFCVSLVTGWIFSHLITKPVLKISRISKEMSELQFEWQLDEQRTDELGILAKSLNYTGIIKNGESQSGYIDELRIIDVSTFSKAQEIMRQRTLPHGNVPLNCKGKSLLVGNIFCAHCGNRLTLTTSGRRVYRADGTVKYEPRMRYQCHYNVRHPGECDGQSGYGVTKLDGIVEKVIRMKFAEIAAAPESEILNHQHKKEIELARIKLDQANAHLAEKQKDLSDYKAETLKVIRGQSNLSVELLNALVKETETMIALAQTRIDAAQTEYESLLASVENLRQEYDRLLTWADLFDTCSFEAKKMIVAQFVKAVRVSRDYNIEIDFNVSFEEFQNFSVKNGEPVILQPLRSHTA